MKRLSLLAVLGVLAVVPASASAATSINVNTEADGSGMKCGAGEECSLRGAVETASEKGGEEVTINVPAGLYKQEGDELEVKDDAEVTIKGAGAGKTIIEGSGLTEVFEVEETSSLILQGVTVTGGNSDDGGGIYVERDAALLVENSAITKNHADFEGGGIYGEAGSSVTVRESTITENEASEGGGIGMETENNCEFDAPAARSAAAHGHSAAAAKPALSDFTSGLVVSRSTIEGNTAEGLGGGIFNGPCIPYRSEPTVSGARADALSEQEGGIEVDQTTIAKNRATFADSEETGIGGGIYDETLQVEDPIVNSTITGNFASWTGGGVANAWGLAVLVNDTVTGNEIEEAEQIQARGAGAASTKAKATPSQLVISEERAANLADGFSGGEALVRLRNTIVSEPAGTTENCEGFIESMVEGAGYNLDNPSKVLEEGEPDTCGMSSSDGDLVGVNPQLDSKGLQANGGPTDTIALLATSPAIGHVPISGDCEDEGDGPALPNGEGKSTPVDQRSEPRPGIPGRGCDIGAYEYQQPQPAPQTKTETPAPAPPAAQILGVKIASPVCASKRSFTVHIQNVKQFGVVSAVISVDGKAKRRVTGKHLRTGINLVGLPKGTFTVSIVAHTKSGQTLHGKRVYHTCHTRLPGHVYLRL